MAKTRMRITVTDIYGKGSKKFDDFSFIGDGSSSDIDKMVTQALKIRFDENIVECKYDHSEFKIVSRKLIQYIPLSEFELIEEIHDAIESSNFVYGTNSHSLITIYDLLQIINEVDLEYAVPEFVKYEDIDNVFVDLES